MYIEREREERESRERERGRDGRLYTADIFCENRESNQIEFGKDKHMDKQ
jgi:hypothetical protein